MAFSLHTAVEGEVKVELHDISQQIHSFDKPMDIGDQTSYVFRHCYWTHARLLIGNYLGCLTKQTGC